MPSLQNDNSQFLSIPDQHDHKRYSDQTNESQLNRFSDITLQEFQCENNSYHSNQPLINQLISRKTYTEQSINIQNKKAINWFITFCWTQNYSLETLWNSIGYYSAYANSKAVMKGKLTVLLLTLVNLSLKLFEPVKVLKVEEMKRILGKEIGKEVFIQTENQVLELFDFHLLFDNNLSEICLIAQSQQEKGKALFLSEILSIQSVQHMISKPCLEQIFELINDPMNENDIKMKIIRVSKEQKYIKSIKLKYSSMFDVDEYFKLLIQ